MPILETSRASVIPPKRNCPDCGAPSFSAQHADGAITTTQGTCTEGHVWLLKVLST